MIVRLKKERGGRGSLPVGTVREIAVAAWDDSTAKTEARKSLCVSNPGENTLDWEASIFDPTDEARYRIVDEQPYLDREEEYDDLTLIEAVHRFDDLTGIGADTVLSDLDEPDQLPYSWGDDEAGRTVTLTKAAD